MANESKSATMTAPATAAAQKPGCLDMANATPARAITAPPNACLDRGRMAVAGEQNHAQRRPGRSVGPAAVT